MLSLYHRYCLLGFVAIFFGVANAPKIRGHVITIKGRVTTAQGEPISDVAIDRLGKTDATGHFKIAADFLQYWDTLWKSAAILKWPVASVLQSLSIATSL